MTPEQIEVVQRTSSRLRADPAFASTFYGRLFELDPAIRSMFSDDLREQERKLAVSLDELVHSISHLDQFVERAMAMGAAHRRYGVRTAHFAILGEALLWAIEARLGEDATPDTMDAWGLAFELVAETMLRGARQTTR